MWLDVVFSYGIAYDYYSIMHYSPFVGGVDADKPTLVPKMQPERFMKVNKSNILKFILRFTSEIMIRLLKFEWKPQPQKSSP